MANEECGGLLDNQGLCTVCVAPSLQIDAGALTAAKVGGAVALPISIINTSVVGRPLFVTKIWSREASGVWREEVLGWERLEEGQSRPAVITASQIKHTGVHNIEILIAVSSRWRWREEKYAFSTALRLTIESEASEAGPSVTIGGDSAGHGNTVYITGNAEKSANATVTTEAVVLKLVRAEKDERRLGLRGLSESFWVPKNTTLSWRGFSKQDILMDGPILTVDGLLAVGRTRSRRSGGLGDIRLLAENRDGTVDEEASRLISRRHFEIYIESNRLILRVTGSGGARINGDAYGAGKEITLNDGDRISPLVSAPDTLVLNVNFRCEHGAITEVIFTRSPVSQKED